tara:strand:+ start:297 stop:689 length:393 start_codon:yes stop_codon:yes gene_type:complete
MCYTAETYNPETGKRATEQYRPTGRYSGVKHGSPEWEKQQSINERVLKQVEHNRTYGGPRSRPAPGQKAAAPEYETEHPSKVQGKPGYQDEGQKKKALEVRRKKQGVKEFSPITPIDVPEAGSTPGINVP